MKSILVVSTWFRSNFNCSATWKGKKIRTKDLKEDIYGPHEPPWIMGFPQKCWDTQLEDNYNFSRLTFEIHTWANWAFLFFSALVSSSRDSSPSKRKIISSGALEPILLLTEVDRLRLELRGDNILEFRLRRNLQGTGEALVEWEEAENEKAAVEALEVKGEREEEEVQRLLKEQEVAALLAGENIWNQLKFMAAFEN